jgi:hypothetical protein
MKSVMACFKVLFQNLLKGTGETHEEHEADYADSGSSFERGANKYEGVVNTQRLLSTKK